MLSFQNVHFMNEKCSLGHRQDSFLYDVNFSSLKLPSKVSYFGIGALEKQSELLRAFIFFQISPAQNWTLWGLVVAASVLSNDKHLK